MGDFQGKTPFPVGETSSVLWGDGPWETESRLQAKRSQLASYRESLVAMAKRDAWDDVSYYELLQIQPNASTDDVKKA